MDGSAPNRMYQNLIVRGRNLKNKITQAPHTFYYTFTHHGMMVNTQTNEVVIGTLRKTGPSDTTTELTFSPKYHSVVDGSCVETAKSVSNSDKDKFKTFLRKLSIE